LFATFKAIYSEILKLRSESGDHRASRWGMRMNKFLVGAVATVLTVSGAHAADIPTKAPPVPQAVPAAAGWNGWYIGGQVGGKWTNDDWNTTCIDAGGAPLGLCGSPLSSIVFPGAPDSTRAHSFNTSGVRYGVYVGAMSQLNFSSNWVFGLEFDYGFSNQSSTVAGILGCSTAACEGPGFIPPLNLSGDSTQIKNGDDYSFRARAGYLVTPDVLAYATGGVAFQKVESTMTCNGAISPACNFSATSTNHETLTGYTVGGGLEWKVWQNWLIRGEYRYSNFGTYHPVFFKQSGILEAFADVKVSSQIATLGIAYLFPFR
jgi:outer membrane immunogenic protein